MSAADGVPTRWWETRAALAAAVLLSIVPLLWPAVPPLYDLPDHLGRYHVMTHVAGSPDLQRHWSFEWALVPNLGVDLLVLALAPLIGVVPATKLVVIAIPALTVLALFVLSRVATGRVSPAIGFALPLAYAAPFQMGFVNYCLSAALALLALAGWIAMGRQGRPWRRTALFVPVAFGLWLVHSSGWGLFGILAFATDWQARKADGRGWIAAGWAAALPLAPLAYPVVLMMIGPHSEQGLGIEYFWFGKLIWAFMLLRDRWMWFDVLSTGLLLVPLYACIRSPSLRFDPRLGIAAVAALAMFVGLPWLLVGGAYVDMRLLYVAAALGVLAVGSRTTAPATAEQVLAAFGALFFVQRMMAATASLAITSHAQVEAARVLPALPSGAAVMVLVKEPCTIAWRGPRFGHLGGLAILERDAFVNSQWTLAGQQLMRPRHHGPALADPSQYIRPVNCREVSGSLSYALRHFDRSLFTHVWLLDFPADQGVTRDLQPVARADRSVLYRVTPSR